MPHHPKFQVILMHIPDYSICFNMNPHTRSTPNHFDPISIKHGTNYCTARSLLDCQLKQVEAEMTDIMKFNDSVLMTIPSIGYINSEMILGEIADIPFLHPE